MSLVVIEISKSALERRDSVIIFGKILHTLTFVNESQLTNTKITMIEANETWLHIVIQ